MNGDKEYGEKYRIAQAQKLLDLFSDAHGRPAETLDELEDWARSAKFKADTAYDRGPD